MIPIAQPYLGTQELLKLKECIDDNWITGGKKVKEFEERIATLQGMTHGVACTNGTSALYMALKSIGIKEGDEVIVPDFTFVASANAITWCGATPRFVDVDGNTGNLDPSRVISAINNKTKAIEPVHIYGQCAEMDKIMEIAREHNLKVVEDAAQAIGVSYKGKMAGSFGDINCFSFYSDKTITTSEGGMCLTDNEEYRKSLVALNNQGRQGRGWYVHEQVGYNFRMTDLAAGIGLAQLDKLDFIIERKKQIETLYRFNLSSNPNITLPKINDNGRSVPFRVNIIVDNPENLALYLKDKGVQTMRFFYPLHRQPCYKDLVNRHTRFPNSDYLYEHGLSLPSFVAVADEQVEYICDTIKDFYKK